MLLIECPWCGPRHQTEFSYGGEAHIARPDNAMEMSDDEWADYVFMRQNPKGTHYERWCHAHGCGQWFNAVRDTRNDQFHGVYKMGEEPPKVSEEQDKNG